MTQTEVHPTNKRNALAWQTRIKTRIDAKGLSPAVANRRPLITPRRTVSVAQWAEIAGLADDGYRWRRRAGSSTQAKGRPSSRSGNAAVSNFKITPGGRGHSPGQNT